jgi:hypothetical protein
MGIRDPALEEEIATGLKRLNLYLPCEPIPNLKFVEQYINICTLSIIKESSASSIGEEIEPGWISRDSRTYFFDDLNQPIYNSRKYAKVRTKYDITTLASNYKLIKLKDDPGSFTYCFIFKHMGEEDNSYTIKFTLPDNLDKGNIWYGLYTSEYDENQLHDATYFENEISTNFLIESSRIKNGQSVLDFILDPKTVNKFVANLRRSSDLRYFDRRDDPNYSILPFI